jgi:hypothetical protein
VGHAKMSGMTTPPEGSQPESAVPPPPPIAPTPGGPAPVRTSVSARKYGAVPQGGGPADDAGSPYGSAATSPYGATSAYGSAATSAYGASSPYAPGPAPAPSPRSKAPLVAAIAGVVGVLSLGIGAAIFVGTVFGGGGDAQAGRDSGTLDAPATTDPMDTGIDVEPATDEEQIGVVTILTTISFTDGYQAAGT